MPVNINCPQCRLLLQLPDQMVGRKVKCSSCQTVFTAEAETPVTAPSSPAYENRASEDDDRPRRRRHYDDDDAAEAPNIARDLPAVNIGPEEREAWLSVRAGLRLQMLAQYLNAGAVGAILFLVLFSVTTDGRGGGAMVFLTILFGGAGMLALLANLVLSLIACGYFLAAPQRHGSRPIAIALLTLVTLLLLRSTGLISDIHMQGRFGGGPDFLVIPVVSYYFLDVIRLTILPLFVLSVGRNMGVPALARHGLAQMIAVPAAFLFLVLINAVLIGTSRGGGPGLALVLMLLNGAAWAGILIWGAILMHGAGKIVAMRTRAE